MRGQQIPVIKLILSINYNCGRPFVLGHRLNHKVKARYEFNLHKSWLNKSLFFVTWQMDTSFHKIISFARVISTREHNGGSRNADYKSTPTPLQTAVIFTDLQAIHRSFLYSACIYVLVKIISHCLQK